MLFNGIGLGFLKPNCCKLRFCYHIWRYYLLNDNFHFFFRDKHLSLRCVIGLCGTNIMNYFSQLISKKGDKITRVDLIFRMMFICLQTLL